ncbi:MAG: histidine kinase, partial [Bacteroidetes bacterium]|nr:histidine kinase [Bacteroidota bacterium]
CLLFLLYIYAGRWLCRKWYLSRQLPALVAYGSALIAGLAFTGFIFTKYVFDHPNAGFIEFLYGSIPFYTVGLITGVLVKLVSVSIQNEVREAQVKAEQKESEFNLLQSQLSPHFLFNVLNNLYGISIAEHQRIPPLLLKLSNLLRYSVYGAKKQFVPLKDEVEYIKNYIGFEQIRISDRLRLTMDLEQIDDPQIQIAPLILIVFVENAFKHAKNTLTKQVDISILLEITGNFVRFAVSNSYHPEKNENTMPGEDSGLGLQNTIKRLDLLYGNDYKLMRQEEGGLYHVELILKVKD